jgi:hypothetical protein
MLVAETDGGPTLGDCMVPVERPFTTAVRTFSISET